MKAGSAWHWFRDISLPLLSSLASSDKFSQLTQCIGVQSLLTRNLNNRTLATEPCETVNLTGSLASQWLKTNLVDPASSHMLVSKITPCMSQYKLLYGETANGSLKQL